MSEQTGDTAADFRDNPGYVHVPNVSAGARSGIGDTVILGTDAKAAYDPDDAVGVEVPAGDLDSRVEWVAAGETQDERAERATAVYAHEEASDPDADLMALGARLQAAVYPSEQTAPTSDVVIPDDITTVPALLAWVEEPDDDADQYARALAVYTVEKAKADDDQRSTLVEPLTAMIEAYTAPPTDQGDATVGVDPEATPATPPGQ